MKIISKPDLTWTGRSTCDCGAVLEFELSDLTRRCGSDMRGDSWDYVQYRCPVCDSLMNSEPLLNSIPQFLRPKIGKKQ